MSQFKTYATSAHFSIKLTRPQLMYLINWPDGASLVRNHFMTEAALIGKGLITSNYIDGFSTDYPYAHYIVGPQRHIKRVLTPEGEALLPLLKMTFPELGASAILESLSDA